MRTRGIGVSTSTADLLEASRAPRRLALVVGIDRYADPAISDLVSAASDARAFGDLLRRSDVGGFDRVETLAGDDVSREQVLRALRTLADGLRPDDLLLLYVSGHGIAAVGPDGAAERFLLTSDSELARPAETGIELDALRAWFGRLGAQRRALIVDACFNGGGRSGGLGVDPSVDEGAAAASEATLEALAAGEAHLFATSPGLAAYEDDGLGGGVYSHFLRGSLTWGKDTADVDEDGVVTAWEAHDFARARTIDHTKGAQLPEATLRVVGVADVILGGTQRARAARALVYDYGADGRRFAGATLVVDGRARGVFPGTMTVPPGDHDVEVRDAAGTTLYAGRARFAEGSRWGLRDLRLRVRRDRVLLTALGSVVFPTGLQASRLWGAPWFGGELSLLFSPGKTPIRPAFGARLGAGIGRSVVGEARPAGWLAVEAGALGAFRRLRLGGTWQLRALVLPRLTHGSFEDAVEGDGWILGSTGPAARVGLLFGDHGGVVLDVGATFAVVDLGARRAVPTLWLGLGLELGF